MGRHVEPVMLDLPDLPGAACRNWGEPLWDEQVHGENDRARTLRHLDAMRICQTCPVKQACRAYGEQHGLGGVYGGVLLKDKHVHWRDPGVVAEVQRLLQTGWTVAATARQVRLSRRTVERIKALPRDPSSTS